MDEDEQYVFDEVVNAVYDSNLSEADNLKVALRALAHFAVEEGVVSSAAAFADLAEEAFREQTSGGASEDEDEDDGDDDDEDEDDEDDE